MRREVGRPTTSEPSYAAHAYMDHLEALMLPRESVIGLCAGCCVAFRCISDSSDQPVIVSVAQGMTRPLRPTCLVDVVAEGIGAPSRWCQVRRCDVADAGKSVVAA